MKRWVGWLALCVGMAAHAGTPGQYDWEQFSKRIKGSEKVAPLGPNLMGEQVQLANGALSFSATDVSLPGNDGLAVAFGRSYSVFSRMDYGDLGVMADWTIDVPNVSTVNLGDWVNGSAKTGNRCSAAPDPLAINGFQRQDFWQGVSLELPGGGGELLRSAATTRPTDGKTYPWVTSSQVHVSCLATIKNGTGEGFLAITPDGTQYWFDHMAQTAEPPVKRMVSADLSVPPYWVTAPRKKTALYVTRVQDRFGNAVTYTYGNAWNEPVKLTRIAHATDGRQLTFTYTGARLTAVSDGSRSWTYTYASTASARSTLTRVTLPDGSSWSINLEPFTNAVLDFDGGTTEVDRSCLIAAAPLNAGMQPVGTLTHPSGAVGSFTLKVQEHGRSNVPVSCSGVTTSPATAPKGTGNNPVDDVNFIAISSYSLTLAKKSLSGPGLATTDWTYDYSGDQSVSAFMYSGTTVQYPVCDWTQHDCNEPICVTDSCAGSIVTTVTASDGKWTRYTHGNSYRYNEGKLLKVETGSSSANILQTDTYTYDLSQTAKTYPAAYGGSTRPNGDGFSVEFHRPQTKSVTSRQSTTFTRQVNAFDYFANPTSVTRSSSLGHSTTEALAYHHNTAKWVIGQVASVTCTAPAACANQVPVAVTYDASTAQQLTYSAFGKLLQTLSYNADGTVRTVKDGNNRTTTLSDWYRGIPRLISHPDGTTQSAAVSAQGWISSVTDQLGYLTAYGYDNLGRLKTITPPTGDSVAWAGTSISFARSAVASMGLPAGHWQRTESRGNYRRVTWFDALWRPVIEQEYDAAALSATQRFSGWKYDIDGQVTFAGYPLASASSIASFGSAGTTTQYDALGRPLSVSQSSELGALTTTYAYGPGFTTTVSNPRNYVTTTTYQAFDTPDTGAPLTISAPEGVTTTISRDVWGKPTSIRRSGSYAGVAVAATRSYVYDANQQLCKRVEPETGATLFDYDAAGNVAWSAEGSTLTALSCDRASVALSERITRSYDALNRPLTLTYPDGLQISYGYEPDGALKTLNTSEGINWTYAYNRLRLLTQETTSLESMSFSHSYNALGHETSLTYPLGFAVSYSPNALGQPTAVSGFASGVQYYPNGQLKQYTYANGIVRAYTQNARQLVSRIRDSYGTTVYNDFQYAFDGNANLNAVTDSAQAGLQSKTLTYDGLDRLLTANAPGLWGAARYAYDPLDNLREADQGSRKYRYSYNTSTWRPSAIKTDTGVSVWTFGFDARGNQTSKGSTVYSFDRAHRLTQIAALGTRYWYDGHGRRVAQDRNGVGKYSLYTQDGLLRGGPDVALNARRWYVYLGKQMIGTQNVPLSGAAATATYHHPDALGSPVLDTNAARTVLTRSYYAPYGEVTNRTVDGPGYTGHEADGNSGLVYMQQRYYDPVVGRFLSVDPVSADTTTAFNFNRFNYANNNPYRYTDRDGRQPCDGSNCPILGKAQSTGTAGHAAAGDADAQRMAASGEYKSVHLDQKLSTITGDPAAGQQRPDVAGVRKDTGGVDTVEHNSKSQSVASQDAKGIKMQQKLAAIGKAGSHQTRTIATALKGVSGKLGAAGVVVTVGLGAAELAQDPTRENATTVAGEVVTGIVCGAVGGCGEAN